MVVSLRVGSHLFKVFSPYSILWNFFSLFFFFQSFDPFPHHSVKKEKKKRSIHLICNLNFPMVSASFLAFLAVIVHLKLRQKNFWGCLKM